MVLGSTKLSLSDNFTFKTETAGAFDNTILQGAFDRYLKVILSNAVGKKESNEDG